MSQLDLDKILTEIKARGLTAYEMSKALPLSEAGINKIINGSSSPRKSTLLLLHNYLFGSSPTNEKEKPPQEVRMEDLFAERFLEELKPYLKDFQEGHNATGKRLHDLTELVKSLISLIVKLKNTVEENHEDIEKIKQYSKEMHDIVTPTK